VQLDRTSCDAVVPRAVRALQKQEPAEGLTVAKDGAELAAILVFVAPPGRKEQAAGIGQTDQSTFCRFADCASCAQRSGLSSGVSISETRIFSPWNQKVSSSTTRFVRARQSAPLPSRVLLHFLHDDFAAHDDRLIIQQQAAVTHRDIEMAGGVVGACYVAEGPDRPLGSVDKFLNREAYLGIPKYCDAL
jgi:hypothetical protein